MALLYYHNRQEVVTLVLLPGPLLPLCDVDKEPPEEIGQQFSKCYQRQNRTISAICDGCS